LRLWHALLISPPCTAEFYGGFDNSQYRSRTVTITGQTDHDDYLAGRIQLLDAWRYRVYGISAKDPNGNPTNAFYDVVLPGPTLNFGAGRLSFDWYQPVHENGNILSYPTQLGNDPSDPFRPADLGTFTLPDGTVKNEPMVPASLQFYDGTSGAIALEYSATSGSGSSRSYSKTLSDSEDVKVTYKTSASFFGEGGSGSLFAETEFHNSNAWGGVKTNDSTTNQTTGITLSRPSGDLTQGYAFYPVFYITRGGTVKTAHAVDVLASATGKPFWQRTYSGKPDPALNLPQRFIPQYNANNLLVGW